MLRVLVLPLLVTTGLSLIALVARKQRQPVPLRIRRDAPHALLSDLRLPHR